MVVNRKLRNTLIVLVLVLSIALSVNYFLNSEEREKIRKELVRANSYQKLEGNDDSVPGTDNVKFSAFFLRDLNGDGLSEKLYGTVKELGESDRLYFEVNVLSDGELKDAKIEIDGKNFFLKTSLLKDSIIKNNVISNDAKLIEFDNITSGKQKLLFGLVRSGDYSSTLTKNSAIGKNNSNYSRSDNKIRFSGTYYPSEGEPIDIVKEIDLTVDWYGSISTSITNINQYYNSINNNIDTILQNEDTIDFSFTVSTEETKKELLLKQNHVEVTIPELNGYQASEVIVNSSNVDYSYDSSKTILTINRFSTEESEISTTTVSSSNSYNVIVKYPKEAYTAYYDEDNTSITLKFPVQEYYLGYNNPNKPYINPLMSNTDSKTISVTYGKYISHSEEEAEREDSNSLTIGNYMSFPYSRYVISKYNVLKSYKGLSDSLENDEYTVLWKYSKGNKKTTNSIVLKETKDDEMKKSDEFKKSDNTYLNAEDYVSFKGIYFNDLSSVMETTGEIKVYDDETNEVLLLITSSDFKKYNNHSNAFYYNNEIKHIRVEVSGLKDDNSINIYNIKEIDNNMIVNDFTEEQFEDLKEIKSTLEIYTNNEYLKQITNSAIYETPYSIADISINQKIFSTQDTDNVNITINTFSDINQNNLGWVNGSFLIKLPDEIADVSIKSVSINNTKVEVVSYEYIKNETDNYIKVITSNDEPEGYEMTINADISPNRKALTGDKEIVLYASNEQAMSYYYKDSDTFDVNDNLSINEYVNSKSIQISIITPNLLLTTETITDYDDEYDDEITVGPQIADIDKEKDEATINVEIQNNYDTSVGYISILGRIPFKGNKYILTDKDMYSEFDTKITKLLSIPDEIKDEVDIYYSENEEATNDLSDENNAWIKSEDVTDYSNIKSYYIDLGKTVMTNGDSYVFSYNVNLPKNVKFNQKSYSTHAVYFAIDTDDGKYQTKTEPTKVGIRMVKKYSLYLTKYQSNRDKLVPGATYAVTELDGNDNEVLGTTKIGTTNENGLLIIKGLLVEKEYGIKEIKTPTNYLLNEDVIKLYGYVEDDNIMIEKKSGNIKGNIDIERISSSKTNVRISVEDEVLSSIKILKKGNDTNEPLKGVRYKLTGPNYENGRYLITDSNGMINVKNLKINENYVLEELKADEYYIADPITFNISNNEGVYSFNLVEGQINDINSTEVDSIPTFELNIIDDRIPTYNLDLIKIKHTTNVGLTEDNNPSINEEDYTYLGGALFYLYKDGKKIGEYTTNNEGKISIPNLYLYDSSRNFEATYVLKEVSTPTGYSKVKDIVFRVENESDSLKFVESLSEGQSSKFYTSDLENVTIYVEDLPSFKLVKTDSETNELLANVKFAIYNIDEGEVPATNSKNEIIGNKETIDGKEYYIVETDENGEIVLDLPEGLYKAVEVEANEKYDLTGKVYYFGIGVSREAEVYTGTPFIKTFKGNTGSAVGMAKTADNGYIVIGTFEGTFTIEDKTIVSNGKKDFYIVKYNSNDEIEHISSFGGAEDDRLTSVDCFENGDYIVAGYFNSESFDVDGNTIEKSGTNSNGLVLRFNSNSELIYSKAIESRHNRLGKVVVRPDGGFIIAGSYSGAFSIDGVVVESNINASNGQYVAKYDSNNVIEKAFPIWSNDYSGSFNGDIVFLEDGGYVISGEALASRVINGETIRINQGDGFLMKISKDDEIENIKALPGKSVSSSPVSALSITSDGDILVAGTIYGDIVLDGRNIPKGQYLIKFDKDLNLKDVLEWPNPNCSSYGSSCNAYINSIKELDDGNYMIVGSIKTSGVIKTISPEFEELSTISTVGSYVDFELYDGSIVYLNNGGYNFKIDNITIGDSTVKTVIFRRNSREEQQVTTKRIPTLNTETNDNIISTKVISDDEMIVLGYTYGTVEAAGTSITNSYYIAHYKGNEITKLTKINVRPVDMLVSSNGDIYLSGTYQSQMVYGNYTINRIGGYDIYVIKLNQNLDVINVRGFGGRNYEYITSLTELSSGNIAIAGYSQSDSFNIDNHYFYGVNNASNGYVVVMNNDLETQYIKSYTGSASTSVSQVTGLTDGRMAVIGTFNDNFSTDGVTIERHNSYNNSYLFVYDKDGRIEHKQQYWSYNSQPYRFIKGLKDGRLLLTIYGGTSYTGYSNGILIYDRNYNLIKTISFPSNNSIIHEQIDETLDGGLIDLVNFSSMIFDGYKEINPKNNTSNYAAIKYDSEFNIQFMMPILSSKTKTMKTITSLKDGSYLVTGSFEGNDLQVNNDIYPVIVNPSTGNAAMDSIIFKIIPEYGANEQSEVSVENTRKLFKITTDINEIDGIKGGSISGEDKMPYESVYYGDNSTKDIVVTPLPDYEIIDITVNGQPIIFEPLEDGSYTLPKFNNVTEDKNVEVTFAYKDNKITINKVDSYSNEIIEESNIEFKLDQIEERTIPTDVIKELTPNSDTFKEPNLDNEIVGVTSTLVDNGAVTISSTDTSTEITDVLGPLTNNGIYYFVEQDGTYIPTNGKTYQLSQGGSAGKGNTTANSYVELDLTGKTGYYSVIVNARVSSQSGSDYGYVTISNEPNAPLYNYNYQRMVYISGTVGDTDYTSVGLKGGKKYYIHLGYYKNGSTDTNEDQIVINSIKVYKSEGTSYDFDEENGSFVSNNQGVRDSVANSYVKIDLTGLTGTYRAIINAEISSSSSDLGYASITSTPERVDYSSDSGMFMKISNEVGARDYYSYTDLEGGKVYYLHFGYRKSGSKNNGTDQFKINYIKVCEAKDVTYNFIEDNGSYISTNQYKANTTSSSYVELDLSNYTGTYVLTVNAEINSYSGDYGYLVVTEDTERVKYNTAYNTAFAMITGNRGPSNFTKSLTAGKKYYLHMSYYKDIYSDGGTDTFKVNSISIVPNSADLYHTTVKTNKNGKAITQIPFGKYEVRELNAPDGYYEATEPIIIEFRSTEGSPKEFNFEDDKITRVIVHHYLKNEEGELTDEKLAPDEIIENKVGIEYITSPNMNIKDYDLIRDENNQYILPDNYSGVHTHEDIEVNYYYEKGDILLTTRHLIEGTENPVPLKDGTDSEFVTSLGRRGEDYTTLPLDNELLSDKYEYSFVTDNFKGTYENDEIVVTYYYKPVKRNIKVKVVDEETGEKLSDAVLVVKKPDDIIFNSNITPSNQYSFVQDGTKYVSNNQGVPNSLASSYIKIDLTNVTEDKLLRINYSISSETNDVGYITITDNETVPPFNSNNGRILYTHGNNENKEVTKTLEKGSVYYVHIGYKKNAITDSYNDSFTINSISLSDEYTEYITDENGEVDINDLGSGDYELYEVFSPTKYNKAESNPIITINRDSDDVQDITIKNRKKHGQVIVHHYLDGTTTPIKTIDGEDVLDEIKDDRIDESYATKPREDLFAKYDVVTDIPENVSGEYIDGTIEVTYYYNLRVYNYYIEYYYNNEINEDNTEKLQAYYLDKITTYPDKKDIYEFQKTENLPLIIDDDNKIIKVYYSLKYDIKTKVNNYIEKYFDGTTKTTKGGSISHSDTDIYETVNYMKDSTKDIVITPDEGYSISSIKVNNVNLDVSTFVGDNGVVTLNKDNGYFNNVKEDKLVEAEFRKKSKVIIHYKDKSTGNDISESEVIDGYQDDIYNTSRKNVTNYRAVIVEALDGNSSVTVNGKVYDETENHVFTADNQEVIYWYELIPNSTVIVKHIEIDNNGIQTLIEENSYERQVGKTIDTNRNTYVDPDTNRNYYSVDGDICDTCINKDTDSYTATVLENEVVEVKYYYQRSYMITTTNTDSSYGTVSGEGLEKYEEVIKNGTNTKEIEIIPNYGYRVKTIKVNGEVINIIRKQLFGFRPLASVTEDINHKIVLPANYFNNIEEDINVEVEFEKISASVIVKYLDVDTNESLIDEKEINGYVGDYYNESRPSINSYISYGSEPISFGNMTEIPIEIIFYYKKQFKITPIVIEHNELFREKIVIPGENINEREITITGGNISYEDDSNYEIVNRGEDSTKPIIIKADEGYVISKVIINEEEIEITDNKEMILPIFTNVIEDKNIKVLFETNKKILTTQFIDFETGEIIETSIKTGNYGDKYRIETNINDEYDYIKTSSNLEGILIDDTTIKLFYKKKSKDISPIDGIINPFTGDRVSFYLISLMTSLLVLIHFARKKNKLLKK